MVRPQSALTRDRVVQAALTLADADGLESLSMRRLGSTLGVEAMSLYHHVPNKDALLDAMVDAIVGQWGVPADHAGNEADWRTGVSRVMLTAHAVLLAHPWAIELAGARPFVGPGRLRYAEGISMRLLDAGFTPRLAHQALHIVDGTIMGFSAQAARRPTSAAMGPMVDELASGSLGDQYPGITRTIHEHHDHDEEYAVMVDLIVDGLSSLLVAARD
jgi:AcrR family transcriptional regulator